MLRLRNKLKKLIADRDISPAMMEKIMKNPMFEVPRGMSRELFTKAFYDSRTSDAIRYAALVTSLTGHHEKFNLTLRSYNKNNTYYVKPKFIFTDDKLEVSHFVLAAVSNKYDPIYSRKSLIVGDASGNVPIFKNTKPWSTHKTPNLTGLREPVPTVEGVTLDRHVSGPPGVVNEVMVDGEIAQVIESLPVDSFTSNILVTALESGTEMSLIVNMLQGIIAAIQYLKSIMNSLRDNIFGLDFEKKYYLSGDPRINPYPQPEEYDVKTGKRTIGYIKGWEFTDYISTGLGLMPAGDYADALPEGANLYSRLLKISAMQYNMNQQLYSMQDWANTIYDYIHELVLTMDPTVDLAEKLLNIDWTKAINDPNISTMEIPRMKYVEKHDITSKTGEMENFENARGEFNSFKDIRKRLDFSTWEL